MVRFTNEFHSHLAGNLRRILNEFERYCATVICDECCVLYTHSIYQITSLTYVPNMENMLCVPKRAGGTSVTHTLLLTFMKVN